LKTTTTIAALALAFLGSTLAACSHGGGSGGSGDSPSGAVIYPAAVDAPPGGTVRFAASLAGAGDIAWSVVEPNGGSIDAYGAYTAPQSEGTFHVIAASPAAGLQTSATVTVRVGAPAGGGLSSTPPSDGTTPWAPAASDASWVNVRSFGAVGDGVTDDTAAFRNAAATGKQLFVPAPPVAYNLTGVVHLQSSIYGDGSMPLIRMIGSDGDPDQGVTKNILLVSNYQGPGLVVNGLHLDGGWTGGTNGEWSHGVNVTQSSNVTIQNNLIENAYGDDVFVGAFASPMSDNVLVQSNTLKNPRRCNVAVNGATRVTIRNNSVVKTGTYVSAIDLEPDPLGFQYVRGVSIDGNTFAVVSQDWGAGAISLNNPDGNPSSGDVSITNNRGSWTPAFTYMDVVSGSGGIVGVVPHLAWYNVTGSNNVQN